MIGLLHVRKMTAAIALWTGYVVAWMVIVGSGVAVAVLWWLVGIILFGSLWLATQPLLQQGRGLNGFFVRPGWTNWHVKKLHRSHRDTEGAA